MYMYSTLRCTCTCTGLRLSQEFPYIEAEVKYAIKEYACTAIDVLARRTRLAFLNVQAADEALPRIIDIMSAELGWDKNRKQVASFAGSPHHTYTNNAHDGRACEQARKKVYYVIL